MRPAGVEAELGPGEDLSNRRGCDDLSAFGVGEYSCGDGDSEPDDVAVVLLHLCDVNRRTDLDVEFGV
ncbi:MAG: hypothetical protein QNM02_01620 [Acidimicrobiia bacterium]|nr:hypothetical protein [Acidimicrobiia bacterium]